MSFLKLQPLIRLHDYNYNYSIINHVEQVDLVWPYIYESMAKFSINWPTFNLGLTLILLDLTFKLNVFNLTFKMNFR